MPESYSKINGGNLLCEGCFNKKQSKLETTHNDKINNDGFTKKQIYVLL